MSAETLRKAAEKLREQATDAVDACGVGLTLADVLDESAAVWDDIEDAPRPDSQLERLARLARLVLGGAS